MAVNIIEEEDWEHRDALEAAQEDTALLVEWEDWDPKTHVQIWDNQHNYMNIPYSLERSPHRHVQGPTPRRLTIKYAWDERYAAYESNVRLGESFE